VQRSPWLLLLAAVVAAACSSTNGSGVTETKKLNQLSAGERDKLCAYRVDVEQAPRTVTCGTNPSVTLKDKASCVAGLASITLSCEATVANAEACYQAIADDPCAFGVGTCTPLFSCVLPSQRGGPTLAD
jgi:hypothetical protein